MMRDVSSISSNAITPGHHVDGDAVPEVIKTMHPGTCVALYMAVGAAAQIVAELHASFAHDPLDVQIVVQAQRNGERRISCAHPDLQETLAAHDVKGETMLLLRRPAMARGAAQVSEFAPFGAKQVVYS